MFSGAKRPTSLRNRCSQAAKDSGQSTLVTCSWSGPDSPGRPRCLPVAPQDQADGEEAARAVVQPELAAGGGQWQAELEVILVGHEGPGIAHHVPEPLYSLVHIQVGAGAERRLDGAVRLTHKGRVVPVVVHQAQHVPQQLLALAHAF